jgi:hypothetical protein
MSDFFMYIPFANRSFNLQCYEATRFCYDSMKLTAGQENGTLIYADASGNADFRRFFNIKRFAQIRAPAGISVIRVPFLKIYVAIRR